MWTQLSEFVFAIKRGNLVHQIGCDFKWDHPDYGKFDGEFDDQAWIIWEFQISHIPIRK
jgi:hypothetical protein